MHTHSKYKSTKCALNTQSPQHTPHDERNEFKNTKLTHKTLTIAISTAMTTQHTQRNTHNAPTAWSQRRQHNTHTIHTKKNRKLKLPTREHTLWFPVCSNPSLFPAPDGCSARYSTEPPSNHRVFDTVSDLRRCAILEQAVASPCHRTRG